MSKKDQDGCAALAVVAVIAFLVGRCSADDKASVDTMSNAAPATLYSDNVAAGGDAAVDAAGLEAAPESEPEPAPPPVRFVSPAPSRIAGTSFRNCSEARAAGAAPVMAGDPGYAPRLDRDGDGVGCE